MKKTFARPLACGLLAFTGNGPVLASYTNCYIGATRGILVSVQSLKVRLGCRSTRLASNISIRDEA